MCHWISMKIYRARSGCSSSSAKADSSLFYCSIKTFTISTTINMPPSQDQKKEEESPVLLLYVRNFPFPGSRWFYKEVIEAALDFQPRDTDILISTFPKCGTNWMKYIVWTIITRGQQPLTSSHQLTYEAVPFMDISGVEAAEALQNPRALHYHLPYHMIPKNPNAKYIYIFRNPKDVVVSFYHFTMQTDQLHMTFEEYFETFMKGLTAYADYFDHVLSWYEHRNEPNVLFLSYEQLHSDTKGNLLKTAKFIGEEYYNLLIEDNDLLETVLRRISFEEMKKTLMKKPEKIEVDSEYFLESNVLEIDSKSTHPKYDVKYIKYFRKGIVGDWKNHLSPEQNRRMEQKIQEKFGGTEIINMINASRSKA